MDAQDLLCYRTNYPPGAQTTYGAAVGLAIDALCSEVERLESRDWRLLLRADAGSGPDVVDDCVVRSVAEECAWKLSLADAYINHFGPALRELYRARTMPAAEGHLQSSIAAWWRLSTPEQRAFATERLSRATKEGK